MSLCLFLVPEKTFKSHRDFVTLQCEYKITSMNKFIKVITASGNIVWINTHNIVSIEESKKNPDAFEVITNGVDLDGETKRYLVEGSPEVFLSSIEASVEYFS